MNMDEEKIEAHVLR